MRTTRRRLLAALGGAAAGTTATGGCLAPASGRSEPCPPTVPGDRDLSLGFAGDAMLGRSVDAHWRDGPPEGVWGSTLSRLRSLDGLFLNLECCLSDRGEPRPGRTYHFRADPDWAVPALEAAGVRYASLANNHLLDFGAGALLDTVDHLADAGIPHAGAGADRSAALDPALVEVDGVRVAVVAFTDQSPSYGAGLTSPGTAFVSLDPADPVTRRRVRAALERARALDPDLLVASLHWGPNWVTEPSWVQRWFARWLVDRGVDLVHGHSAHVLQGVEVRRGRPIVYDAGDYVDDYVHKPELRNKWSALFELQVRDGAFDALHCHPVEIRDETVHEAGPEAAAWVREQLRSLSAAFGTRVERAGEGLRVPLMEC